MVPSTVFNVAALAGAPASVMGTLGPWLAVGSVTSAASNIFIYSAKLPEFKSYVYRYFNTLTRRHLALIGQILPPPFLYLVLALVWFINGAWWFP